MYKLNNSGFAECLLWLRWCMTCRHSGVDKRSTSRCHLTLVLFEYNCNFTCLHNPYSSNAIEYSTNIARDQVLYLVYCVIIVMYAHTSNISSCSKVIVTCNMDFYCTVTWSPPTNQGRKRATVMGFALNDISRGLLLIGPPPLAMIRYDQDQDSDFFWSIIHRTIKSSEAWFKVSVGQSQPRRVNKKENKKKFWISFTV